MLDKVKAFFLHHFPHHTHPRTARFIKGLTWGTLILIVLIKLAQVIVVTLFVSQC